MADRALTKDAVLAGLQDIRLPTDAAGGLLAELLVASGLGLLLALGIGLMLRSITRSLPTIGRAPSLSEQVEALSTLPETERQLALLHLLKANHPSAFAALADRLYRAGALPGCPTLEEELLRHV